MAVPEIYSKILRKLSDKAKKGEVDWKSTSGEGVFLVNFKDFSLSVGLIYDNEEFIYFQLRDNRGKDIDFFKVSENDPKWGDLAFELYNGARRKALKVDEAVEIIGKELGVDDDNDVPF
jgi:hypothetical protein